MSDARDKLDWDDAKHVDIAGLAHQLGARLRRSGRFLVGACPLGCASQDGFIINPEKRLFFCRPSDARGDAVDMVEHVRGCSKVEALAYVTGRPTAESTARRAKADEEVRAKPKVTTIATATTTADALMLWGQGVDPRETLAELYLNRERKLELGAGLAGEILRWHPGACALLALFRNILTGEPQAVSRIFIDRNGKKTDRKFLGPVTGAAMMLDAFEEVLEGLHIGEGLETCMTGRQRYDFRQIWALGSTSGITSFPVLRGIECLTLLRENDGGKSAAACERCAARWHGAGREVRIDDPDQEFKDLNDILTRGAVE
jgi:putative DNA primase/helicase